MNFEEFSKIDRELTEQLRRGLLSQEEYNRKKGQAMAGLAVPRRRYPEEELPPEEGWYDPEAEAEFMEDYDPSYEHAWMDWQDDLKAEERRKGL